MQGKVKINKFSKEDDSDKKEKYGIVFEKIRKMMWNSICKKNSSIKLILL